MSTAEGSHSPAGYPRDMLKAGISEAKRLRTYYFGDFYTLSEVTASPHDWCVTQYHRPEEGDGIIVAFRRHASPYASFICTAHDIDVAARYRVKHFTDYTGTRAKTMTGEELIHLRIDINDCPGSMIAEYQKVP